MGTGGAGATAFGLQTVVEGAAPAPITPANNVWATLGKFRLRSDSTRPTFRLS